MNSLLLDMLPKLTPTTAESESLPSAIGGFRLSNENASDGSDNESDQSETHTRSLSPLRGGLPKARKKKERKRFGALAEDLDILLGAAFTEPGATSENATQPEQDVAMQADSVFEHKQPNKRARQNMKKAAARKLQREQADLIAAQQSGLTLVEFHAQQQSLKQQHELARQGDAIRMTGSTERTALKDTRSQVAKQRRARKRERREKTRASEGDKMVLD